MNVSKRFNTAITLFQCILATFICLTIQLQAQDNPSDASGDAEIFTVAVVRDGDSPFSTDLITAIKGDLNALLTGGKKILVNADKKFSAGWQKHAVADAMQKSLKANDIDAIVALGRWSLAYAGNPKHEFGKPVIAVGAVEQDFARGLYETDNNRSGKKNLSLVLLPIDVASDAKRLQKMTDCKKMVVVFDEPYGQIQTVLKPLRGIDDLKIAAVAVENPKQVEDDLKTNVADAAYLTIPGKSGTNQWKAVIAACNNLKLPTFSQQGAQGVEWGALAGELPDYSDRLARQAAINLEMIVEGRAPESLPVEVSIERNLALNSAMAGDIDYSPSTETLSQANFELEDQLEEEGEALSIKKAFSLALANNPGLMAADARVKQAKGQRGQARGGMLPQAGINADYTRVRTAIAKESEGSQPESATKIGASVQQMLFNDEVISEYMIASRKLEGSRFAYREARLNLLESTALSYFALLRTDAMRAIALDNLKTSRKNLEVARNRHKMGQLGPEDVYRWEAQVDSQKAELLEAETGRQQALHELNRVIGLKSDKQWQAPKTDPDAGNYAFIEKELEAVLDSNRKANRFKQFMAREALASNPALQELKKDVEAGELAVGQVRRSFYLPKIYAKFDYSHTADRKLVGVAPGIDPERDEWSATVSASLPIFEGGRREAEVVEAKADLKEAEYILSRAEDGLEKIARDICTSLASSYRTATLQNQASQSAQKNLKVARDCYSEGECNILTLLDAQSSSFVAQRRATIAKYAYLGDVYRLQRISAWFLFEHNDAENAKWRKEFEKAMTK